VVSNICSNGVSPGPAREDFEQMFASVLAEFEHLL